MVGPERAHRLVTPLEQLIALQQRVARATDPARLAGQAKELGAKLFDGIKAGVKSGGGSTSSGGGEGDPAKAR